MAPKNDTVLMLAQSLEQPRVVKRIIEKSKEYEKVEVYGFKREIHEVHNYDILKEYANIELIIVGSMANNQYIGRLANYLKLISLIYSKYKLRRKHIYVFGLDLRIVAFLLFNAKVYYEISDILWLYKTALKKSILRKIDLFMANKSHTVIFTSKGFYDEHYSRSVKPENTVIKENKFKTYGKVHPVENIRKDQIRVAYIGAFRYSEIIENLLVTAKANHNLILNFYGDGFKDIVDNMKKSASEHDNIFYHGAFKNPDDLEKIYSDNNLNFVVYKNTLENEKVAMPNKFYESGFFNIPIVCAENTYVGRRVLEVDMGWTIGIDYQSISNFLNNLRIEDILKCHLNIKKLDKAQFES